MVHLPNTSWPNQLLQGPGPPVGRYRQGGASADSLYDSEEATETVLHEELRETMRGTTKMEKVLPAVPHGPRGRLAL
jgi:hypothetical protein